jgi:2-hydroxycyclohexanecarboxyl-CoA dehydrogenase
MLWRCLERPSRTAMTHGVRAAARRLFIQYEVEAIGEDQMTTTNRKGVVTGGTSGIGFEAAKALVLSGTRCLVINGRNVERGKQAVETLKQFDDAAMVHFVQADVSTIGGAQEFADKALKICDGSLDTVVNCAGGDFAPELLHNIDPNQISPIISHWLLSSLYCCRLLLPAMREKGCIINVASDAAKFPTPGESVIGAAMAGIVMFSKTLAMEAKRRQIRVNVVTPSLVTGTRSYNFITSGGFSAKLFEKATAAARLGLPSAEDVAALIAFLASEKSGKITGQVISVNGGISAA